MIKSCAECGKDFTLGVNGVVRYDEYGIFYLCDECAEISRDPLTEAAYTKEG